MANKAISALVIGGFFGLGLAAAVAVADEPDPGPTAAQASQAVRTQMQTEQPDNGYGSPLAVAGEEVGQQNTRRLGPGDGSGNQAKGPTDASARGTAARNGKGNGTDYARVDKGPIKSTQNKKTKKSKPSATGTTHSRSTSGQGQRLRDPASGCSGIPTMTRSHASSGQRRGGGRR